MTFRVAWVPWVLLSMASTGVSWGKAGEGVTSVFNKSASFRLRLEPARQSHMEVAGGLEHLGQVRHQLPSGLGRPEQGPLDGRRSKAGNSSGRPSCALSSRLHLLAVRVTKGFWELPPLLEIRVS